MLIVIEAAALTIAMAFAIHAMGYLAVAALLGALVLRVLARRRP